MDEKRIAEERLHEKKKKTLEAGRRLRQKVLCMRLRCQLRLRRTRIQGMQQHVDAELAKVKQLKSQSKVSADESKRLQSFLTKKVWK